MQQLRHAAARQVDGTKIAAAASERQTRSYDQIAAEILAEADDDGHSNPHRLLGE